MLDLVRKFDGCGRRTEARDEGGIPYLTNAFWTAAQRRAHRLHEISYRACFKPQLPAFFIDRLTAPGETVLDPFMGRGTTPLQAALSGRVAVGSDVNPLSALLVRPRLRPPGLDAVGRCLNEIPWTRPVAIRADLLTFYHPETLTALTNLREWLLQRAPDPAADWVRMVALNRLTGHSPGFFSVYTLPPNQAASVASQTRINTQRRQVPPRRDVPALILKKSRQLLQDLPPSEAPHVLATGPADRLTLPESSVALTVTSPPFLDVVQYAGDNWLRCWFAGIDPDTVPIAMHRSEAGWQAMVRAALAELARVTRPGGHVAFEVGEVRRGQVLLERLVWAAAEGLPFQRLAVLVNQQDFTKTANCWGVANNARGTNSNRIVLLRRL